MKKRHSAERIVGLLRQADVNLGKGSSEPDVCRVGSDGQARIMPVLSRLSG